MKKNKSILLVSAFVFFHGTAFADRYAQGPSLLEQMQEYSRYRSEVSGGRGGNGGANYATVPNGYVEYLNANNNQILLYVKRGSIGFGKIDNQFKSVYGEFFMVNHMQRTSNFYMFSIKQSDCKSKNGMFLINDNNGRFIENLDFVIGRGNLFDVTAGDFCNHLNSQKPKK